MRKHLLLLFITHCFIIVSACALTDEERSKGFVYLHEVDPTILVSSRYGTIENFTGHPVDGYKANVIILTKQTAEALQNVQKAVSKDGYCLVVYDGYRPARAVKNFMGWSKDVADQVKKAQYYPRVDKERVFELGYVAERSGHSRGSTVDLTLIKKGRSLHPIKEKKRILEDGFQIVLLDDGTLDCGSSFDLFDVASHYENTVIKKKYKKRRKYLKDVMEKHGFKNYAEEWWHFTLRDEPYPAAEDSSYFDFEVQ